MRKPAKPPDGKWDGSRICKALNRTDRRLRQIAQQTKYFPEPENGYYDPDLTIAGFVKYLDEMHAKRSNIKEAIDDEKYRKLKLENDEAAGLLEPMENIEAFLGEFGSKQNQILHQRLEVEAPIATANMDASVIAIINGRIGDEIRKDTQATIKAWRAKLKPAK